MSSVSEQDPVIKFCFPYAVDIPTCVKEIVFPTNNADIFVTVYFVDKFNKEYVYSTLSDGNGDVAINTALFPMGLFNEYAGDFIVFITPVGMPKADRIFFRSDSGYYPSVRLHIVSTFYANMIPADEYNVTLQRFKCCCTANTPCGNYNIEPCTGLVINTGPDPCCDYEITITGNQQIAPNMIRWNYTLVNKTSQRCVLPDISLANNPSNLGWVMNPETLRVGDHFFDTQYQFPLLCVGGDFNLAFTLTNARCFVRNANGFCTFVGCDPGILQGDVVIDPLSVFVISQIPTYDNAFGPAFSTSQKRQWSINDYLNFNLCCGSVKPLQSTMCIRHIQTFKRLPGFDVTAVGINGVPFGTECSTQFDPLGNVAFQFGIITTPTLIYELSFTSGLVEIQILSFLPGPPPALNDVIVNLQIEFDIKTDCIVCDRKLYLDAGNLPGELP